MRKRGVYDVKGWVGRGAVRARERERARWSGEVAVSVGPVGWVG